jgi:DNA primase
VNVRAVLQRLRVEVVEEVGSHLWALCPYHPDRKPSWRIRSRGDRAGLHHCFACQEGGDLADLVQQVRGYATKAAAYDWLEEHGEQADREDLVASALTVRMGGLLSMAPFRMPAGFEAGPLGGWPHAPRLYAEKRQLPAWQVDRWGVGYALEGRLGGRLVLPVVSGAARLASYMARAWDPAARRRYLYPREEEHADLDVLFGEARWLPRLACVVTEGALKSLAVERAFWAGDYCQVSHAAIGGSGVRPMHVGKLASGRFKRVVILTDADPAGERAGDELQRGLARHVDVVRARLEPGQDADSVPLLQLRSVLAPYVG